MVKTVLVADDEVTLTELISDTLKDEGYNVIVANNGDDAMGKIKELKPDLIILDVMMPGLDGYDVSFYISLEKNYRPKIMMLTGKERGYDKTFGQSSGADVYMTKPFDLIELVNNVNKLLKE
ncbi:MAG: response regulator [Elusimicrobiota bacterium]